jgi:hypothetical protein
MTDSRTSVFAVFDSVLLPIEKLVPEEAPVAHAFDDASVRADGVEQFAEIGPPSVFVVGSMVSGAFTNPRKISQAAARASSGT